MKNKFAGAIWTNHALERMKSRLIPKEYAVEAFKNPDTKTPYEGGFRLIRKVGDKTITVVTKSNGKGEWLVLSVWMSPPAEGTEDARKKKRYNEYRKASLGRKLWLTILKQLGM